MKHPVNPGLLRSLPVLGLLLCIHAHGAADLRPPAVPLVSCDPYFCIWSCADRLTDDSTRHWTGATNTLTSMVRVDGRTYRLMGVSPADAPAATQTRVEVTPTRSIYTFETPEVALTLTFTTPLLPDDLDTLSWPITWLNWEAKARDGRAHEVRTYYDNTGELAVNVPSQQVTWSRERVSRLDVLRMGSKDQPVLAKKGDNLRIDWGYVYAAAPSARSLRSALASADACRGGFLRDGSLPSTDDAQKPRGTHENTPVMAFVFDLGKVGSKAVSRHMVLAYDDLYGIEYFRQPLRSYWRRNGAEAPDLLKKAVRQYESLERRCREFDREFMSDLERCGGIKYARLCALAYRQCFAGNKLVADANGQPLLFPKENFSNGCIGTVDVIYPMEPMFLLISPTLTKASLTPLLDYAASPRWRFPFAPHDLGTYPKANGQVYGGGERTEENQMPVEESGNMLLLLAALSKAEGNPDYCARYWPVLERWAEYLKSKGFDPENQLCTDDFAGHLAHNINLSAKAILGLAAYGQLCQQREDAATGKDYINLARQMAQKWVQMADDGDHFRLAFDKPGTWSQKYNLVWDRILGLNIFPPEVVAKEMAFYKKTQKRYGLPLDNRKDYTKLDWTLWTATLTGSKEDFQALVDPVYDFLNETPDRVPMTDWYSTSNAKKSGFQARSVVGGVFIQCLYDPGLWKKWVSRDKTRLGKWAPLPTPLKFSNVVPTAQDNAAVWSFTVQKPENGWFKPGFAAADWRQGKGGFGTRVTPGASVGTEWKTPDIWLRREFQLPALPPGTKLLLQVHHDEEAEIYINGIPAANLTGFSVEYEQVAISPAARASLREGKNILAVHCHQTGGGQYIDVGLARESNGR